MLVDAAKGGDVEIPVFCYEPKLGAPVGACRMCLVEVEGIPKLRPHARRRCATGWWSTPRPTASRRPRTRSSSSSSSTIRSTARCATRGRVPAAGHRDGLGSRAQPVTDPKRHFKKPVPLYPGPDRPRALHPLLPLRALQPGDRRGRAAAALSSAARGLTLALSTPAPTPRSTELPHRALPSRRTDLRGLPVPRPPVGHRGRGLGLRSAPLSAT